MTKSIHADPPLSEADPEVFAIATNEADYQRRQVRLIASENYASRAVQEASATVLANKYSEGYPAKRYYEGQRYVDQVEQLAIDRAKALFGADHANVQPYSGSPANLAVYTALLEPGDTILGMALPAGGHLTHGWKVSATGKFWKAVQYGVHPETHLIDMDEVRRLAEEHRPKAIICGASAYPRVIDFEAFGRIARDVGAVMIADMAHIAGLVAAGEHPSPIPHADAVTTTTHKTLRGPRGGMILSPKRHAKAIDRAVFPGLQGGPHNHTTAAIAVALKEAATPAFVQYAKSVRDNAKYLGECLVAAGFSLTTGGTDNHLLVVDVTRRGVTGGAFAKALAEAGLVTNMNSIPFDPRPPADPSGIRIGTPAVSSRGFGRPEMEKIAGWIDHVARHMDDAAQLARVAAEVEALCARFPAPGIPA
ncbi:MAG: serine hydroxymethyltransferase [Deltaproteobacteria bacterium]|nr:serine hydroxymethyltransferase [Deltaproteobacteria bacterium]